MSEPRAGREYACSRPCSECPAARNYNIEKLRGRVDPLRLIGQLHASFWLPCHMDPEYAGQGDFNVAESQCAGAAIYRANIGIADGLPPMHHKLAADRENVFSTPEELLAHHLGVSVEEATKTMKACPPIDLIIREMERAGAGKLRLSLRDDSAEVLENRKLQQIGLAYQLYMLKCMKAAGKTTLTAEDVLALSRPDAENVRKFAQEHLNVKIR